MFYIYIRACKKYGFDFMIGTFGGLNITLYPKNTFENINISQSYYSYNYNKLFLDSIKEMKAYRKKRGTL